MTHAECVAALLRIDRRVYLLALVSQIAESCLTRCAEESVTAVAWALDATRRWCLGLTDREEVEAAADAAAASDGADATAYVAAIAIATAATAYVAAIAIATVYASCAASDAFYADAARQRLVDSVRGVVWGHPTPSGYVVSPTHVWVPRDVAWGRWVPRAEVAPEDMVRADVALEAA